MSRATNAPASRERRRRILEETKGFRGPRSKNIRQAMEARDRARQKNLWNLQSNVPIDFASGF